VKDMSLSLEEKAEGVTDGESEDGWSNSESTGQYFFLLTCPIQKKIVSI